MPTVIVTLQSDDPNGYSNLKIIFKKLLRTFGWRVVSAKEVPHGEERKECGVRRPLERDDGE